MKKLVLLLLTFILALSFTACGSSGENSSEEPATEVGMILDGETVDDGAFNQTTWEAIKSFCHENDMGCQYYKTEESSNDVYMTAIEKAVEDGNKIIVLSGGNFEEVVYKAQNTYSDIYFLLIDGLPHNSKDHYDTADNTVGVLFAEEESGYLAGYAAVKDGYTKLGFMGGKDYPAVKRYGYGFLQGAADAAEKMQVKVTARYEYENTFNATDEVKEKAVSWFEDGTEVIFACGGNMNNSVIEAAESANGKIIGVDVNQGALSDTIITSAKKNLGKAVDNVLSNYKDDDFGGGTAYNYAARNNGIDLEMKNARFNTFSKEDYDSVYKKLKEGKITIKKDTDVESASELSTSNLTIIK